MKLTKKINSSFLALVLVLSPVLALAEEEPEWIGTG